MTIEYLPAQPYEFHAGAGLRPPNRDRAEARAATVAEATPGLLAEAAAPSRPVTSLDGVNRYALVIPYNRYARDADATWIQPGAFATQLARTRSASGISIVNLPVVVHHDQDDEVGQIIGLFDAPDDLGLCAIWQLYTDTRSDVREELDKDYTPVSAGFLPIVQRSGPFLSTHVSTAHLNHLSLSVGWLMGGAFREARTSTNLDSLLAVVRRTRPEPGPAETFDKRMTRKYGTEQES